jgi:hypothetical protein
VRDQLASVADQPASDTDDAVALRASFREPPPERGEPMQALLARLGPAVAKSFNTAGPGYLAFIPGGGVYAAALADYVALATNRYVGVAKAAPALAEIEAMTVRWLAALMGYGPASGGVLTSGGSMSNLVAIVTAREIMCGEAFADAVIYASEETHHSVHKAARFAGFPARAIRRVPTDTRFRVDPAALERAIDQDRTNGRRPAAFDGRRLPRRVDRHPPDDAAIERAEKAVELTGLQYQARARRTVEAPEKTVLEDVRYLTAREVDDAGGPLRADEENAGLFDEHQRQIGQATLPRGRAQHDAAAEYLDAHRRGRVVGGAVDDLEVAIARLAVDLVREGQSGRLDLDAHAPTLDGTDARVCGSSLRPRAPRARSV